MKAERWLIKVLEEGVQVGHAERKRGYLKTKIPDVKKLDKC